jgi:hypothetical protein
VNRPGGLRRSEHAADHCFDGYDDIDSLIERSVGFWRRTLCG